MRHPLMHRLIEIKLKNFEKVTGESVEYMRELLRHSLPGFFLFVLFMPLSSYRGKLSKEAFHLARISAIKYEDCGPCLQMVVTMAARAGVDHGLIRNTLENDKSTLSEEWVVVLAFVQATVENNVNLNEARAAVTELLGERAVTDLALVIASVRVYPMVKRAMGYARSCSKVQISI